MRRKITNRLFEEGNNVIAVLLLLESGEGHGRTRDVLCDVNEICKTPKVGAYLFGVCEVLEKRVFAPDNSFLLVCLSVLEPCCLASMTTEQTCHVTGVRTRTDIKQTGMAYP